MIHDTQSAQISQKQDGHNMYAISKTTCSPGYHHNGFVATHALGHMMCGYVRWCTLCAQVHELPQSHCGDNWKGTLFSWLHIYIERERKKERNIYICMYLSFQIKYKFRLMHPMLEHSVTHNSTISQNLLKRIEKNIMNYRFTFPHWLFHFLSLLYWTTLFLLFSY